MNRYLAEITCDLIVIGTGMAGMAAALFAATHHIDTVQVGDTGETVFASGLLDLLGVHPVADGQVLKAPWQGIARLCREEPRHPYARMNLISISESMNAVLEFLKDSTYPHIAHPQTNMEVITPAGTVKPTYAVPHTMAHGPSALADQAPCLIVDFYGLKGFSASQIALSLKKRWPGLRPVRVAFPDARGELLPERMARSLDLAETRLKLISAIRPHIGDAAVVALPAVVGLYRTEQALMDLEQGLGVPVFEIPTMLPSVTGLRLKECFQIHLPDMGVRSFFQQSVLGVRRLSDGRWLLDVGRDTIEHHIIARAVILCSGRFFSKGLHADRRSIRETIFGLSVVQPSDRAGWHRKDLFDRQGHPINRAGLAVDDRFRPVDENGRLHHDNVFAAGSILAHHDWVRQKCGSGLAIATAYGAVKACRLML